MPRPKTKLDLTELEKLYAMQCTDEEVAAFFGVSTRGFPDRPRGLASQVRRFVSGNLASRFPRLNL